MNLLKRKQLPKKQAVFIKGIKKPGCFVPDIGAKQPGEGKS